MALKKKNKRSNATYNQPEAVREKRYLKKQGIKPYKANRRWLRMVRRRYPDEVV